MDGDRTYLVRLRVRFEINHVDKMTFSSFRQHKWSRFTLSEY